MKAGIQFSGGKDSLALLHYVSPWLNDPIVYHGDTGDTFPHVLEFVRETCEKLKLRLRVVKPPIQISEYIEKFGYPSDIVPVEASLPMRNFNSGEGPMLQSGFQCCTAMLFRPLMLALQEDGITDIYRGSKKCDDRVGVADGFEDENGVTYHSPLWDWTDADVFDYLKRRGIEPAHHYKFVNESLDCVNCTAYLKGHASADRVRYTRDNYPERWPEFKRRLQLVNSVVSQERAAISEAMSVAEVA